MATDDTQVDWATLCDSEGDERVPVALFALCKAVVEDADQGTLFLNATLVQRVVVKNVPTSGGLVSSANQEKLKKLLFPIKIKSPLGGGEVEQRRVGLAEYTTTDSSTGTTTQLCSKTMELVRAPLNKRRRPEKMNKTEGPADEVVSPRSFSFVILGIRGAAIDLELQAEYVDFGGGKGSVLFFPDLLVPTDILVPQASRAVPARNKLIELLVKVQNRNNLNHLRTLALLNELPVVEFYGDLRRKRNGVSGLETYPRMILIFWLHEPTSVAMYNVVGPLVLVVAFMIMNFEEFFGFSAAFGDRECVEANQTSETCREFFNNGIGIALAAFFVIPAIRSEPTRSPGTSFTADHLMAMIFLLGLALSNAAHCQVALVGCLLSCMSVLLGFMLCIAHLLECSTVRRSVEDRPVIKHKAPRKPKPAAGDFLSSQWNSVASI